MDSLSQKALAHVIEHENLSVITQLHKELAKEKALTRDEESEFRQAVLFCQHVSGRTPQQHWYPATEEKRALIRHVKQPQYIAFFNRFNQPQYKELNDL